MVRYIPIFFFLKKLILITFIEGFIDNETPITSGSGTQHTSWNSLQKGEDLNDFFARIYK